jgi:outer membrane protein assembly factor BamB
VANNGRVYLAAGSSMYQFRLRGGQFRAFPLQQWVGNDITSTPIITDKFWFFGDRDGYFHAFNNAGKPAQNADGGEWKVKLEGKPQGTPVMSPDTIYVSTDRGFIYGIDIAKGQVVWTYRTEAPKGITPLYLYYAIRAPMAASDNKLFVLGDDGTLTCLSPAAADDEGPMITTPRPGKGVVMNGAPPITIGAYMWDEGSGINPDTVEVLLDGKPIDMDPDAYNDKTKSEQRKGWTYDPLRRMLRYNTPKAEKGQPEQMLLNGRHKVQLQAADWKGNFSSLEWTFVVDNSLPRNAIATTKPKTTGAGGAAGGYPGAGGAEGGAPTPGGASSGMGNQNGNFRNGRFGGYTYGNRGGQQGYGFGQQGGGRGGSGGFGGRGGGGGFGGRGGGRFGGS